MSNNTVRAFIAVELNEALRLQLKAVQEKLRASAADVKWVRPVREQSPFAGSSTGKLSPVSLGSKAQSPLGAFSNGVEPPHFHLTLKFLGDVPEEKIADLCAAIEQSLIGFKKFEIELNSLGSFPAKGTPRIIWAGVGLGSDLLSQIAASLEKNTYPFYEKKDDKKFSAHITLGRVRAEKNIHGLISLLKQNTSFSGSQTIDQITLFQSTLAPTGPAYSLIRAFKLH